MTGRKFCGVGMIQICIQADKESHRTKLARRNFLQPDGFTILVEVQPGDRIGDFQPRAITALQREIADQITDTGDGKRFTRRSLVAKGRRLEVFAGDFRRNFNLQRPAENLGGQRAENSGPSKDFLAGHIKD